MISAGANVSFINDKLNVYGLYHTSKNLTAGAGLEIAKSVQVLFSYTTLPTGSMPYISGAYEAALKFNF